MAINYGANAGLNKHLAGATGYGGDFSGGLYQKWLGGQGAGVQQKAAAAKAAYKPTQPIMNGGYNDSNPANISPQLGAVLKNTITKPVNTVGTGNYGANTGMNQGLAQLTGYKGDFSGGGFGQYRQSLSPEMQAQVKDYIKNYQANGVEPVGAVEPFNPWQKNALTTAYGLLPGAGDFGNVKNIYGQAVNAANASADPRQNPELMNTIKLMGDQSVEMRNRLNPTLNAGATSAGAFGGTRDAVQRSLADESAQKNFDYMQSGLLTDQYNKNFAQNMQKSGVLSQLGGANLGLFDYGLTKATGAGNAVQAQNQTSLDAMNKERLAESDYGRQMIDWYNNLLGSLKTNSTTQSTSGNAAMGALGGGMAGYGLYSGYNPSGSGYSMVGNSTYGPGSGSNPLPWQ